MDPEALAEIIAAWDDEIAWTANEIAHLTGLLTAISEYNRGRILEDVDVDDRLLREHAKFSVEEVLDPHAATIIRRQFRRENPFYRVESDRFVSDLPFVEPNEHMHRIDLNLASADELEALPGIGPVTAPRIIAYRRVHGGIRHITELKKVDGLSDSTIRKFAHRVYLRTPSSIVTTLDEQQALVDAPSFGNLVRFIRASGMRLSIYARDVEDLKTLIVEEIEGIKNRLEIQPRLHGYSPGVRSSFLEEQEAESVELQQLLAAHGQVDLHGVLLRDASYYYFCQKLLRAANDRIRIVMFYLSFRDEPSHPTDALMDEIIAAKNRGVDIKVILDHQDEMDPKPSRLVNEEGARYLADNNVPVVFDTEEIATHTKLLLVDDRHVVVGSHNWTASSFFVYRDTSVYLNSVALAGTYLAHFDHLWASYQV